MSVSTPDLATIAALSDDLIALYEGHHYDQFDETLATVPPELRMALGEHFIAAVGGRDYASRRRAAAFRMCLHPAFQDLANVPLACEVQGVFYVNQQGLRTRINFSYFDPRPGALHEVDYRWSLRSPEGQILQVGQGRIGMFQTQTFEVAELLKDKVSACGIFNLQTAVLGLGALRTYAIWYNEQGATTTHEKGHFRDSRTAVVFPSVIVDAKHDTYLAVANDSPDPVRLEFALVNHRQQMHPQRATVRLAHRSAQMPSVAKLFNNCERFLDGQPGCIWARSHPAAKAMFYYLIHNKERDAWQLQHV